MTSNPPRMALWLLRHTRPGGDNDPLTGDLIERMREGQTRSWLWRQVAIVLAVAALGQVRTHWPHLCYAIAGTVMPAFLWTAFSGVPRIVHWWVLPWPWSQLVLDLSVTILLAWAALPVLAAGLLIDRTFRWASLLRTALIILLLIVLGRYLAEAFPTWFSRPLPGNPHVRTLIVPGALRILFFFARFLIAAWVGCRLSRSGEQPHTGG